MEIYSLIANQASRSKESTALSPSFDDLADDWPDELVRRAYAESPPPMKRILELLATTPGRDLASDELAKAIGPEASWPNLAGTLGAFGRRVRSRYQRRRWFFNSHWDHDLGKMVYSMPDRAAESVREAGESSRVQAKG
jgi:hypothetical protein